MDLGLKNKVAFVAASSQGLGKSVALELAREGAKIIICGRNSDALGTAETEIKNVGAQVLSLTRSEAHRARSTGGGAYGFRPSSLQGWEIFSSTTCAAPTGRR